MSVRLGILRGTRSEYQVLWELVLRIVTDPNAIFVISGVRGYRDPFHTSQIWTHLPVNPSKTITIVPHLVSPFPVIFYGERCMAHRLESDPIPPAPTALQ